MKRSGDARKMKDDKGSEAAEEFPVLYLLATVVDATIDGFLIGVSVVSGTSAGLVMTMALTIELSFLSLTLSMVALQFEAQLNTRKVVFASCILPPIFVIIGGVVGASITAALMSHHLSYFLFIHCFAIGALLYLVTMKLLRETAESDHGDGIW
eukprot:CAMPEP_0172637826 /NCGR_PEP_ID=MMETSP1068-20121228/210929_1 /TAXON_ID=35684 /ORGANISM="Pseudopedinella elastica, Strain CCMP716" /LENGTH=153 /DNA_ID=CAMNT_0013450579 /DNA_START=98 /DNA_END=556 /DNA_ORIENTATION=+